MSRAFQAFAIVAAGAFAIVASTALTSANETVARDGSVAPAVASNPALALMSPPVGGVTAGLAGTTSITELIASQPFEVASVSAFDIVTQKFLVHIPGAPAHVNSLGDGDLKAEHVVLIRRAGSFRVSDSIPIASRSSVDGDPGVMPVPPVGGLTAGLAGTNDLDDLLEAQRFTIESVASWDTASQRWLVNVVGAPETVNSLTSRTLTAQMVVFMRRAEPTREPAYPEGPAQVERITYYFCRTGSNPAAWGDGGGFCGTMRSGNVVHDGAAACSAQHYGQKFRIEGDPTGRVYTCEDTGGGVGAAHRDIWFENSDEGYNWFQQIGPYAEVIPLS